jgi:hypothetical protein
MLCAMIDTAMASLNLDQTTADAELVDQERADHARPVEWGWAWPANRRQLYGRASADVLDFRADEAPDYLPPPGSRPRRRR